MRFSFVFFGAMLGAWFQLAVAQAEEPRLMVFSGVPILNDDPNARLLEGRPAVEGQIKKRLMALVVSDRVSGDSPTITTFGVLLHNDARLDDRDHPTTWGFALESEPVDLRRGSFVLRDLSTSTAEARSIATSGKPIISEIAFRASSGNLRAIKLTLDPKVRLDWLVRANNARPLTGVKNIEFKRFYGSWSKSKSPQWIDLISFQTKNGRWLWAMPRLGDISTSVSLPFGKLIEPESRAPTAGSSQLEEFYFETPTGGFKKLSLRFEKSSEAKSPLGLIQSATLQVGQQKFEFNPGQSIRSRLNRGGACSAGLGKLAT